jgi:hypothetical protein
MAETCARESKNQRKTGSAERVGQDWYIGSLLCGILKNVKFITGLRLGHWVMLKKIIFSQA